MEATPQQRAQVIRDYTVDYPDPIIVQAGEPLTLSGKVDHWNDNPAWVWFWCTDPRGKSGWMPQNRIETRDQASFARVDYSAVELAATVGEILSIEATESGWFWCVNQHEQRGWIPQDHVTALP